MKEVVGNSYSFSMKQLFKRNSVVVPKKSLPSKTDRPLEESRPSSNSAITIIETDESGYFQQESTDVRLVEEGRAFFCSELVAKCWKVCGVMKPTDQASSNFLPVNFSQQKQTVEIADGIDLQCEQLIFSHEKK